MGNPLLDISAVVKTSLLTKHNLKSNDAILTEDEQIFKDLQDGYKVGLKCPTISLGLLNPRLRRDTYRIRSFSGREWVPIRPNITS